VLLVQVSIARGHGNRLTSKQFLHGHNIYARHDEIGGEGVSAVMESEVADPGASERVLPRRTDGLRMGLSLPGEHVTAFPAKSMSAEFLCQHGVHRNVAGLSVLRVDDRDDHPVEVDAAPCQREYIAPPQKPQPLVVPPK